MRWFSLVERGKHGEEHPGPGIRGVGSRGLFLPQPYRTWTHGHTAQTRGPERAHSHPRRTRQRCWTDAGCFEFSHVRGEAKFGTEVEEVWEDRGGAECGEVGSGRGSNCQIEEAGCGHIGHGCIWCGEG